MNHLSDNLKEKLNNNGYKLTPQRQAVLDVFSLQKGKHLSCEEVFGLVSKTHPGIGQATVYRTLPILEKMELVKRIYLEDGFVRYELNDFDRAHSHHHLVCTSCGSLSEVEEDMLESLEKQIYENSGFVIRNHSVKFYGLCKKCLKE